MEIVSQNSLILKGSVESDPTFSHESHGIRFYSFRVLVKRLSDAYDELCVIAKEELLDSDFPTLGEHIHIISELRSFNKRTEAGSRLLISAFAKKVSPCKYGEFENALSLTGTVCKAPVYRKTPLGREICDVMLAVNRRSGRSDYLPLIIWGQNARHAEESLSVGDVISLEGRVQSREYIKNIDGKEHFRTAYEVSVSSFEKV